MPSLSDKTLSTKAQLNAALQNAQAAQKDLNTKAAALLDKQSCNAPSSAAAVQALSDALAGPIARVATIVDAYDEIILNNP